MTRASIAEILLSLTSPSQRARAAVGDLMEHAEARGPLWFWTSVLHAATANVLRQWIAEPLRLIGIAIVLWLQFIGRCIVCAIAVIGVWACIYVADNHTGLELLTEAFGTHVPLVPPAPVYGIGLWVLPSALAWMKGAEIAEEFSDVELTLWTAVTVVWTLLGAWTKLPTAMLIPPPLALLAGLSSQTGAQRTPRQ